jgi:hypothetical protein
MSSFLTLFHFDGYFPNRHHEEQFQWFVVGKNESAGPIGEQELKKLVDAKSDHAALMSLARLLGSSLGRESYELFIENLGLLRTFFYDVGAQNADGFTDFEGTKNLNYDKFRLFKFASFLDLLSPGSVAWRGQADLESIRVGLEQFEAADLQRRTSMLSRWIQNPRPSAFSEDRAKRSDEILKRRAFLLQLETLSAAQVARRLDDVGVKHPRKYSSYTQWFASNRKSFESWLSRERAASRRVWRQTKKPKRS